jgi:lipid-binding SYLF domain-containing protein
VRIEGTEGVEELFVGGFHVEGLAGLGMLVIRTREGVWRHGDIHKARSCSCSTLCCVV